MIEPVSYRDATSWKNNDAARGALVQQPFVEHLQGWLRHRRPGRRCVPPRHPAYWTSPSAQPGSGYG